MIALRWDYWDRAWFWFCVGWATVNTAIIIAFLVAFGWAGMLAVPAFSLWAIAAAYGATKLWRKARRRARRHSLKQALGADTNTKWGATADYWKGRL